MPSGTWADVRHNVDGTVRTTTADLSGSPTTSANSLSVGRQNDYDGNYWEGSVDELRISDMARTTDWLATEYSNQSAPSSFVLICTDEASNNQPSPCATPVQPSNFSFNRPITLNHSQVMNTDQVDFPVLIAGTFPYLATVANGGKVQNANGYDIVFRSDGAGQNKLDHEIESYDPVTGTVAFWVRIPLLSHTADTQIYVWYGSSAVTNSQESKTGVWRNGYAAVWHPGNGSTLSTEDSTGFRNNGVVAGSGIAAATGKVNGSASFGGSTSNYISVQNSSSLKPTSALSVEAVVCVENLHCQS
jgi:hypothetical protein